MLHPEVVHTLRSLRARAQERPAEPSHPLTSPILLPDEDATALLLGVARETGATSLLEVLLRPELDVRLSAFRGRTRSRVLRAIWEGIELALTRGAAVGDLSLPPETRAEVLKFAAPLGLSSVLERPMSQVPDSPRSATWVLAGDVLLPMRRHLDPGSAVVARRALRLHLAKLAARVEAARAAHRALTFDAALPEGLTRLLESHRGPAPSVRWLPYPTSQIRMAHAPTSAAIIELAAAVGDTAEATVDLSQLERGELRVSVRRGGWGDVQDAASAAFHVLRDALREPNLPAGAALRDHLAAPAWRRMLAEFHRSRAADDSDEDARLGFRLAPDGRVAVVVQRRRKNGGGFGVGTSMSARQAERFASSGLERRLITLCDLTVVDEGVALHKEVLRALADHPRVYFGTTGAEPLRVVESPLALCVLDEAGQRGLALRLGDAAPTPLHKLDAVEGLVTDLARDPLTLRFAELPEVLVALVRASHLAPGGFPSEADELLVDLVATLQADVPIELPGALAGARVEARPTLGARGTLAVGGDLDLSLVVRPAAGASPVEPGRGPTCAYFRQGTARAHVVRDLEGEAALASALWSRLPIPASAARGRFRAIVPPALVLDVALALSEEGVHIELPEGELPRSVARLDRSGLRARVSEAGGYFTIGGDVTVDEQRVALDTLLVAAREGRRFVEIAPGKFATIAQELREDLERLADVVDADGVLTMAAMPVVDALFDDETLQQAAEWRELRDRMRRAKVAEFPVPAGLRAELRDYQREGFTWMARLAEWGAGGCLADDMGLGKTIQTLALLLHRAPLGPALVMAPTSVVDNWAAEAAKFAPSLEIVVLRGQGRGEALASLGPRSVGLISYDVALRDLDALEELEFATLVLDEAQAVKNPESKRSRAVGSLRAQAKFALSGTPIENHLGELWSLYRAVLPGLFGSVERFRSRFALPIERDRDAGRRRALGEALRPFLLRRTKESVAPELPPRTEVVRTVELGRRERARYDVERRQALAELEQLDPQRGRVAMLARLMRLRRCACDVRLIDPGAEGEASKLTSTLELLDEILEAGHTALVFSQFTTHLALVRREIEARGLAYAYLDGQTPAATRAAEVARFQAGQARLFLLSLKAGGTGLNLTAADYVLHLDPWWNPAAEDQATDRAHRIGQDKPVTVVRLVTKGTIEEAVLALHDEKRSLARAVLDGADAAGKLSASELIALVR
ncbi:MAG: DEAD/DEAH box helicase [Polyangiaceae bacterium]|nr:DEAD/DEAH box helicase [Polyangiaceae bacterium]